MKKTIFLFLELIMITSFMYSRKLHKAVKNGNLDEVKKLVEMGEDINKIRLGNAPLHLAVKEENYEIAQYLIEKGTNVNLKNKLGKKTPLHLAVSLKEGYDLVKLLIDNNADVSAKTAIGYTPLYLCACSYDATATSFKVAQLLIEKGANVLEKSLEGATVLHPAAANGNYNLVKLFLENGAKKEIDAQALPENYAALHWAAEKSKLDVARLLIENGANLELKTNAGRTPLQIAITFKGRDSLDIAKVLIENGANVNAVDSYGLTALDKAIINKQIEIAKFLINKDANVHIKTTKEYRGIPAGSKAIDIAIVQEISDTDLINELSKPELIVQCDIPKPLSKELIENLMLNMLKGKAKGYPDDLFIWTGCLACQKLNSFVVDSIEIQKAGYNKERKYGIAQIKILGKIGCRAIDSKDHIVPFEKNKEYKFFIDDYGDWTLQEQLL